MTIISMNFIIQNSIREPFHYSFLTLGASPNEIMIPRLMSKVNSVLTGEC